MSALQPQTKSRSLLALAAAALTMLAASGCELSDALPVRKSDATKQRVTTGTPSAPPVTTQVTIPEGASRAKVQQALRRAAQEATRMGVQISASVSSESWEDPAQVDGEKPLRLWSMAKPVTAVAALNAFEGSREDLREIRSSMRGAIRGSENCRQRLVVLWLQQVSGGPSSAADAFRDELATAGARVTEVSEQAAAPSVDCTSFLQSSRVDDPLGPAVQLGTTTWTSNSASRFALSLAEGELGKSGEEVFGIMQLPKKRSREQKSPDDYTADVGWGAGKVMGDLNPGYKAGWGGIEQGNFVAGQLIALRHGIGNYGIAVYAIPSEQPPNDDPGKTNAPAAVEAVLKQLRTTLIPN